MKLLLLFSTLLFFLPLEKQAPPVKSDKGLEYLALGDSYTIGEKVSKQKRFPIQLIDSLENYDVTVNEPKIIAQTGWTTGDLIQGIKTENIEGNTYDIVTLLIGVNNQYQGRSLEEYKKEYEELLKQAITFANGKKEHVFVLSIPDYGYTPLVNEDQKEISKDIQKFNRACKEITKSHDVKFHNITPVTREVQDHPEYVAKDGLHPTGQLYAQWVDQIVEPLLEVFE